MRKVPLRDPRKSNRTVTGEERAPKRKADETRTPERDLRAEEKQLDRRRRMEERQAREARRSEERELRAEERNLDARRRVDEKRAAEARRAEEERRLEWQAREDEKARRHRSKMARTDERAEEKEHRMAAEARKRRLRDARRAERAERKKARPADSGFYNPAWKGHTVIAVLLAVVAVYIAVSMVLREHAGGLGVAISGALLGCFSYTAFLIPLFMLIHALLWRKDVSEHTLIAKALSFPSLLLVAAMLAGLFATAENFDAPSAYLEGQTYTGGGAVGGAIAHALLHSVGVVGIILITLIALAPFAIFYLRRPLARAFCAMRARTRDESASRASAPEATEQATAASAEQETASAPEAEKESEVATAEAEAEPTETEVEEAPKAEAKPESRASARRRELFRDLEEDVLTVDRQPMDTGARSRRVFDFDSAAIEEPEDDIFAPPAQTAQPSPAPTRDLMGWDDEDDFSDDTLGVTTERLRPIATAAPASAAIAQASAPVSAPAPSARVSVPASAPTHEEKAPAEAGLDYFRSITVTADTRGSAPTAAPVATPAAAPTAPEAVPTVPPVSYAPTAAPVTEEEDDEVVEEGYTVGPGNYYYGDEDEEEEGEEEIPEETEAEEEVPFTATSSLRTDLSAARALAPEAPKARTDTAFRPLTAPDERREAATPPTPPKPKKPYQFPPISLLAPPEVPDEEGIASEVQRCAENIVQTLENFKLHTHISGYSRGPRITRYEVVPDPGVRVRSITALTEDIALSLAAESLRIEAPIPGKAAVGIEVPNEHPTIVRLRHLLDCEKFRSFPEKTVVCLGEDVAGQPVYCDIAKTPHMLVAGATGMGKSVCINSILTSILYKATPDEVKLILIDPKRVEFKLYENIPHLLVPVVTEPKKAAGALSWAVSEMERRFGLFETVGVKDTKGYNRYLAEGGQGENMPRIIVVIDELHDLMMSAKDMVETSIARITAKARAAGIHLIIGTQRPSVDVITGVIKNNIPTRISFRVSSQVDSRTILDFAGAEKLLSHGDMLYSGNGSTKPQRVQGAFVDENEIKRIVEYINANNDGVTDEESERIMADIERESEKCAPKKGEDDSIPAGGGTNIPTDDDDHHLEWAALEVGFEFSRLSTSLLQRKLKIGYGKAAKILDALEEAGYISESDGMKPREILITREEFKELRVRGVEEQTGGNF